jgi:hypothetical protein
VRRPATGARDGGREVSTATGSVEGRRCDALTRGGGEGDGSVARSDTRSRKWSGDGFIHGLSGWCVRRGEASGRAVVAARFRHGDGVSDIDAVSRCLYGMGAWQRCHGTCTTRRWRADERARCGEKEADRWDLTRSSEKFQENS